VADERPRPPNCDPGLPLFRCYTHGDYDGDRKADLAMFRPGENVWHVKRSSDNEPYAVHWGQRYDKLVPADYNGDGVEDFAVFRETETNPKEAIWFIYYSASDTWRYEIFGSYDSSPAPADYDGDGKADLAVVRRGVYSIRQSKDQKEVTIQLPTVDRNEAVVSNHNDIIIPDDYDGDGKADPAIYDQQDPEHTDETNHPGGTRMWIIRRSTDDLVVSIPLGGGNDIPVPGDYNGDGKTDVAVWHPGECKWTIIGNLDDSGRECPVCVIAWGQSGDVVAPADYDGDGKTDLAAWRPDEGVWAIRFSELNLSDTLSWGLNGDIPIPMSLKRVP
jgi:hypothetical protein